jgi:hypothetical protein
MVNQFINKKDLNFSGQETKDILNHLMKEYLDDKTKNNKMTFDEMVTATASDLGISNEQIRIAFSHPSAAKMITDLESSHNQLLQADQNLIEHLSKPFAFKSDLKFSLQEVKDILAHAKENYFGKREYEVRKFEDTIQGLANDLGLTTKQVRAALSTVDKNTFRELERTHDKRVKAHFKTLEYIETANFPKIIRVLKLNSFWKFILKMKKSK